MDISPKLAELNRERFQDFGKQDKIAAAFAFAGDTYKGLDIKTMSSDDILWAQKHLRILSGLYGLLKPLDLMQAYRLEKGTKLDTARGKNLYEFWGDIITNHLNDALAAQGDDTLINLASNEYFKSVKKKALNANIITPSFKDWKNGQYKMISFFAKKARGLMARYIIENKLTQVEALKSFNYGGYQYNEELSKNNDWVFTRKEA